VDWKDVQSGGIDPAGMSRPSTQLSYPGRSGEPSRRPNDWPSSPLLVPFPGVTAEVRFGGSHLELTDLIDEDRTSIGQLKSA